MIGGSGVGKDQCCYIIAEAGSNHNRNLDKAFQLIDTAKNANADAIKFQLFTADTISVKRIPNYEEINLKDEESLHQLYKANELPMEWLPDLFGYADSKNMTILSTPFDEVAVDKLYKLGAKAFKVASFEITHLPLLRHIAQTGKPVLLSTGMASIGEIEEAVQTLYADGCHSIGLFHCGISYPMEPDEVNLRVMDTLYSAFSLPVGYSDHTLGVTVPIAAVARGASMIEKHFTLDRKLPGPDHVFALDPSELKIMVDSIRISERAIGSSVKESSKSELIHKRRGRRSIYARRRINKGEKISEDMLIILRPGIGLHPRYVSTLVGRKTIKDIQHQEAIQWDHFMN